MEYLLIDDVGFIVKYVVYLLSTLKISKYPFHTFHTFHRVICPTKFEKNGVFSVYLYQ